MKHDYAKRKLTSLLADDLKCYTDGEFARQMMRIIDGATEFDVEKMIDQNASIAMSMIALKKQVSEQQKVIDHIANSVGCEADPMACWESVDALMAQVKELQPAYHQLKQAISAMDICGVPLHHLSHNLSKHFDIDTVDFSQEMKINNLDEFRKQLRKHANENQPYDCSEDMTHGWKSAMFEVFCFLDELMAEECFKRLPSESGDEE